MSEEVPAQNVSPEELIEFFTGTGVNPICPTCSNPRSSIQAEPGSEKVRLLSNEYVELQPNGSLARVTHIVFPTVLTACDRCGFVRTFALSRINAWLNEKHPGRRVTE